MKSLLAGYLAAWTFWLQISLGSLGILLIHNITGGRWGDFIRPHLLRVLPTLYLLAIAFLPLLLFLPALYPWANDDLLASIPVLGSRSHLMNPPFFIFRAVLYFAIWLVLVKFAQGPISKAASGVGLLLLLFSASFASMDWIMTLSTDWASTGFGVVFIAGCLINGFSFSTIMAIIREKRLLVRDRDRSVLIDLGNLLLMSVLFWAYMDYMQFLIAWSGQIPKDMGWYDARSRGAWLLVVIALALFHFFVPFVALLFRSFKQSPSKMAALSAALLSLQLLEDLVMVAPSMTTGFWAPFLATVVWCSVIGFFWISFFNRGSGPAPVGSLQRITAEVRQ